MLQGGYMGCGGQRANSALPLSLWIQFPMLGPMIGSLRFEEHLINQL
jgi:hypothetical protein